MGGASTSRSCRNWLINNGLLERLYKYFAKNKVLDECDNELIKDRYSTVHARDFILTLIILISIPALGVAVAAYFYEEPEEPDYWSYREEEESWIKNLKVPEIPMPEAWVLIAAGSSLIGVFALIFLYRLYILFSATSFIFSSRSLDSHVNTLYAAIREREIVSFGVLASTTTEVPLCSRQLRIDILKSLREMVHNYISSSERFARESEKEKLLSRFFTGSMAELALSDTISDEFLRLPALKDLWKLMFLLRSEFIRLVLLRLLDFGCCYGLRLAFDMRRRAKQQNRFKSRFSKAVRYAFLDAGEDAKIDVPEAAKHGMTAKERAAVQLGLKAGEENQKVVGVLQDTIDLLGTQKRTEENLIDVDEDREEFDLSEAKGDVDEVFEGVSEAQEVEPVEHSLSYTTKHQGKAAMTRALVSELKSVLSRKKKPKKSISPSDSDEETSKGKLQESSNSSSSRSSPMQFSSLNAELERLDQGNQLEERLLLSNKKMDQTSFKMGLLEALQSRANLPATNYGDSDVELNDS